MGTKILSASLFTISIAGAGTLIGLVFNEFLIALVQNPHIETKLFIYALLSFALILNITSLGLMIVFGLTPIINLPTPRLFFLPQAGWVVIMFVISLTGCLVGSLFGPTSMLEAQDVARDFFTLQELRSAIKKASRGATEAELEKAALLAQDNVSAYVTGTLGYQLSKGSLVVVPGPLIIYWLFRFLTTEQINLIVKAAKDKYPKYNPNEIPAEYYGYAYHPWLDECPTTVLRTVGVSVALILGGILFVGGLYLMTDQTTVGGDPRRSVPRDSQDLERKQDPLTEDVNEHPLIREFIDQVVKENYGEVTFNQRVNLFDLNLTPEQGERLIQLLHQICVGP